MDELRAAAGAEIEAAGGLSAEPVTSGPSGLVVVERDGTIVHADSAACALLGHTHTTLRALDLASLLDVEPSQVDTFIAKVASGHGDVTTVMPLQRADGQICAAELSATSFALPADDEMLVGVRLSDLALGARNVGDLSLANTLLHEVDQAALVVDADARVLSLNQAYTEITGHQSAEALGRQPCLGEAADGAEATVERLIAQARQKGIVECEIASHRMDGSIYPAQVKIRSVATENGLRYAIVFRDRSADQAYEERIDYLAHYDALTGLANRTLIEKRIEAARLHAAREGRFLALLFLDLDGFKAVNDSLGHAAGDELLRLVARRLLAIVGERDTVARQGGDEFVVLLDSIARPRDAAYVAGKIMAALKVPLTLEGQTVFTTASIGISCYPEDGHDLAVLLHNADMAMYRAKRLGHDRYEYYRPEMNENAHWVLSLRNNLHQALERKEFRVYYQPFVDMVTGRVTGIEALLRWQNAELGMVSPADFIPIAEETGLILSVGEWVLREACHELKRLHGLGYDDLRVAVNLSARQFRQTDLAQRVLEILEETGLEGRFLELEITETVLMEQAGTTLETLYRLEQMGVAVALDDFGTGYSSLNYLKRFPINYLKIDKSFVDGIPAEEGDVTITRTIIGMARSLGIRVTAEGVETDDQRVWLRDKQCEEAQGYLFSIPLVPDDLQWLLAQHAVLPVQDQTVHTGFPSSMGCKDSRLGQ
ncbi:EAL domain-containing protein [Salinisphaera sp. SPP-AMP-43]|uniref:putative bifunctional diguanylate cyclase/phosphodiesterase n=1 Tax=Salinisphaera sp. SPP-AMP-43 TaxID=3121288 RepID=UPI003C6E62A2